MEALVQLAKNFINLNVNNIMFKTMTDNPFLQSLVTQLNKENQLQHGLRSDGVLLPDYSERSVNEFGKEPGAIKLKDTGEFYESFEVILHTDGFEIIADSVKFDFEPVDLLAIYGEEVLGLTEESQMMFIDELLPFIQKSILNEICK